MDGPATPIDTISHMHDMKYIKRQFLLSCSFRSTQNRCLLAVFPSALTDSVALAGGARIMASI